MNVKRLKEILDLILDEELEVFVKNSHNICGNISELEYVEISSYGFMGTDIPCVIINSEHVKDGAK
jgi:hypothetical protein